MNKKSLPALILALILVFGAVSCAKSEDNDTTASAATEDGAVNEPGDAPAFKGTVMETENISLSAAEFTYYYMNMYLQFSYYSSYYGFSNELPLDEQPCAMSTDPEYTWHDFFVDETEKSLEEMLVLCEKAMEMGLALDDEYEALMDSTMEDVRSTAESVGMTPDEFLKEYYGEDVTVDVLRSCMEKQLLAGKAADEIKQSFEYTAEELLTYRDANKDKFYFCDYRSISVKADYATGDSADNINAAKAKAKEQAETILNASVNESAFLAAVEAYYRSAGTEEDDLDTKLDATLVEHYGYTADAEHAVWLFATDASGAFVRRANEATMISDDDSGKYTVYFVCSPAYCDDYRMRDVRHILITLADYDAEKGLPDAEALAKAESILAEWKNGDATEESFAALATEHTMDGGSATTGGLYEGVYKGQMVEPFENWLFSADTVGETGIVKTDYGYHVMYYAGESDTEKWAQDAEAALRSADYAKEYSALEEKYTVTVTDDLAGHIKQAGF